MMLKRELSLDGTALGKRGSRAKEAIRGLRFRQCPFHLGNSPVGGHVAWPLEP